MTEEQIRARLAEVSRGDLATIIYTSGTTGQAKGAMLDHNSFLWLVDQVRHTVDITEHDVLLSFLPLAHIFERFCGQVLTASRGSCVAFSASLASLSSDMVTVQPTIMIAVPRFLESVQNKIVAGVKKQKPLSQKLFAMTMEAAAANMVRAETAVQAERMRRMGVSRGEQVQRQRTAKAPAAQAPRFRP